MKGISGFLPIHLFDVNHFTLIHFLIQHGDKYRHPIRQLLSDQIPLNQIPKNLQQLENTFGHQAIIKSSAQNCAQFPVQFKGFVFEVFIILDEGVIHRVQGVISTIGKDSI